MTKQPTLTKADLIEEVLRITELPMTPSNLWELIRDAQATGRARG